MIFTEFLELVEKYRTHSPQQRYGQAIMNVLHSVKPELYTRVYTNELDIFYTTNTDVINKTLVYLQTHWHE